MTVVADPPRERLLEVPVEQIEVGHRWRVQRKDLTGLKAGIERRGLLHPITVTTVGVTPPFSFKLASGAGRLQVHKELGRATIPAFVRELDALEAEEVEITENLIRNDLTVLEEAEHLWRYDEILRERGERAVRGDNRFTLGRSDTDDGSTDGLDEFDGASGASEAIPLPKKTTKEISEEYGFGDKSWERRLKIAKGISPEIRDILRETEFADQLMGLLELARLDTPLKQRMVAETIAAGQADTVSGAIKFLEGPSAAEPSDDRRQEDALPEGPGADVGERYKVVRLEGNLRHPTASWHMRHRTIKGEIREYPREDAWVERHILLTTDERALDTETGLDFLVEDLTRQLRDQLKREGYPARAGWK